MKTIGSFLQAHLAGELTTLAQLVKITRVNGTVLGLTSHDVDLDWGGVLYHADGSFSPGALEKKADLKAGTFKVAGILDSALIAESDLKAGYYDHARIDVFICNWQDLSQGVVQIRRGWLGDVIFEKGEYTAAFTGLHDLLQRRIGAIYTPECRHDLGDALCGVSLDQNTVTGAVSYGLTETSFMDFERTEASGVFNYGCLTWTSGANAGLSAEILSWDAASLIFTLWLPMPNVIAANDRYRLSMGCDKRFTTCRARFSNAVNFGGFPHLAGLNKILQYPESS